MNHKLTQSYMDPEQDIIINLNKRNPKTLKEFFIRFYPSLCIFSKKYIPETDIAEDIAQDSFMVYWESPRQFENLDNLKGFLYQTAKNKCFNHLKTKGLRAEILKQRMDRDEYFYELVLEEETYRIVHKAIRDLSPQSRRIIELSMKGYKNPEIAEELNVSVNTVKTLKLNAYKTLRIKLKDHIFILFLLWQILNS
ncbi:MAG: sigma-70 family RNA polymerase sigma factor [Draconibacterium sp.]